VHASVDLQKDQAIVEHLLVYADAPTLVAAVRDAGYAARIADTSDGTEPAPSRLQQPVGAVVAAARRHHRIHSTSAQVQSDDGVR
jgi:hypothetical protein